MSSDSLWGVVTHVFSRKEKWLIGNTGSLSQLAEEIERYQMGVEEERYFDQITLSASGGWQKQSEGQTPFFDQQDEAGFVVGLVRLYLDDNLLIENGLTLDDMKIRCTLSVSPGLST